MHKTRSPVWLLPGIAGCLLFMTFSAAWLWQRTGETRSPFIPAALSPTASIVSYRTVEAEDPSNAGPVIESPEGPADRSAENGSVATEARSRFPHSLGVERQVAHPNAAFAPPVADRITLPLPAGPAPTLPSTEPGLRRAAVQDDLLESSPNDPPVLGNSALAGSAGRLVQQGIGTHAAPDIVTSWPYPERLVELLVPLTATPTSHEWASRLRAWLGDLHTTPSLGAPRAGTALQALQQLAHEGLALSNQLNDMSQRVALMRAVYALQRRLAIWEPVHALATPGIAQVSLRDHTPHELTLKLQAAVGQLDRLNNAQTWREYLLLDQLQLVAAQQWQISLEERNKLAREFLQRLESANATLRQAEFFAEHDWQALANELREWVCEPVDYEAMLDDIERVELNGSEYSARDLADHYQALRWSSIPQVKELGERINTYYRNANVRVAISGKLINRLMPHPPTVEEQVDDRLMGGRVFGRSRVSTRLRLVLLPDRERWRIGLEARGDVDSNTQTKRGPARFHNAGRSRYLVRKLLLIDRRGVHSKDADGTATTNAALTRLETDMDGIPLVNLLVRAIAKQQYDSKSDAAKYEAEELLANRAKSRFDQEVEQQLSEATSKFRHNVWEPLYGLGLRPETVDMQTTQHRLIARYRLASSEQMGAFTPRPQAHADSLLSIQVHESALNNVVASLRLGGREVGLRELFTEVASKLQRKDFQVPEDVPDRVTIRFTDQDPIRFEFRDQCIYLTIRIAKLSSGDGRTWRNFEVCGMYVPDVQGIRVGLRRDSYIRLKGSRRRLSTLDTAALRTIFTKVLAKHPEVDLLANVLVRDQRLHDLRISQFVICDGWIGIAVGAGDPVKMHIADDPQPSMTR